MSRLLTFSLLFLVVANLSNAYWLMAAKNVLTIQRMDPVVAPGKVSGHVHTIMGGSAFSFDTTTADLLNSQCTSIPIKEDKSNYWVPQLYFQWSNGSFTSVPGNPVIYYLFSNTPGTTTAFPDNFRMITGDPTLREYNASSFAQQAVTYLCLNFNGVSTRYNQLPPTSCPDGIRAQINFPSCWDGKNTDSPTHNTHVAFLSTGPDSGTCTDPKYPVTLPRIFMEMYWGTNTFDGSRSQAMNPTQPFVFSYGDATGYGYHGDFINGWEPGVLQNAVNKCNCNEYGDPTCCAAAGIFTLDSSTECFITDSVDETVLGTLPQLPGNNPVQGGSLHVPSLPDPATPAILSPVCVYTSTPPATCGTIATPAVGAGAVATSASTSSAAAATGVILPVFPATTTSSSMVTSPPSAATPPSVPANDGGPGNNPGNPSPSSTSSVAAASPTPSRAAAHNSTVGGAPCMKRNMRRDVRKRSRNLHHEFGRHP